MTKFLESVNAFVWGAPTLTLILGVGLYLSIATGFAQVRLFPKALAAFLRKRKPEGKHKSGVSPFQALCTALAATVGTGNLAGVAGAIALGGPGAIFWMWVCAFFGMITKFAEAALAVRYREREPGGGFVGGPMYIIQNGLGKRWRHLASVYAFFGVAAAFGVGNATQINALIGGVNMVKSYFGGGETMAGNLLLGLLLAICIGAVLLGGAKRIGKIAEYLVPLAAAFYLVFGLGVLAVNYQAIPQAFSAILRGAFSPQAVTGGLIGSSFQALRVGASRGVFTNEAGMGTAAIAHGSAEVSHPVEQGLMGIIEVFVDTIVICTMTALVILCSGVPVPYGVDQGVALTARAFTQVYGGWVCIPIALALCCFAFATVLGWGLYGARCAQYLFGKPVWRPFALLQSATALLGAVLGTGTVWLLSETVNGLMAIPNLIALAALCPELARIVRDYQRKCKRPAGGTYENIHQCKPLRTVAYEEVPPPSGGGGRSGEKDPLSEHWPA